MRTAPYPPLRSFPSGPRPASGLALLATLCLLLIGCQEDPTSPGPLPGPLISDTDSLYTFRVVNEYPHDPGAFTQGLVFQGGWLFEGTGLTGQSSLRRVVLGTGEVVQKHDLPADRFGEGIVIWEGQFAYQTDGWGLTHDGEHLIMSNGSATLYFRDPETFTVVRTVQVLSGDTPVQELNELEYIEGRVFANVWRTDLIAVIDPATGRVTHWIDLSGLLAPEDQTPQSGVLNGIAYDPGAGRLFVTGKRWPKLFEIELVPAD